MYYCCEKVENLRIMCLRIIILYDKFSNNLKNIKTSSVYDLANHLVEQRNVYS